MVIGRLTVVKTNGKTKQGGYIWLCKCECGNEHSVSSSSLVSGLSRSCGCLNREQLVDRVGQKFNKLTIIAKYPGHIKKWVVRCECGNEKVVLIGNLISGCTKSCGCWLIQRAKWQVPGNKKAPGIAARNALISGYKRGATERGLSWELTDSQFETITKSNCYYCGVEPYRIGRRETDNGHYVYNGIDRVNNKNGYTIENSAPCCKTCNRAKDVMTEDEFISWISRVYKHYSGNRIPASN